MFEVETIEVDDDNRIVVYTDDDSEDPCEWGWEVELHDIDDYCMWRGCGRPNEGTVEYAAHVAHYNVRARRWTEEQRDRAIHIYKLWAGDEREFKVHDWRGYSKSDWATVLEIGENIGLYETYAAWRRGDVYTVVHQKREQWSNADETAEMDTWEWEDSLSGCYLDDTYTAKEVAKENFDITFK